MSSSRVGFSVESLVALRHLREAREVDTVILRLAAEEGLTLDLEGYLTDEELLDSLPTDQARLVVHDLPFAREGTRRHEFLLIFWAPPAAPGQEKPYNLGYAELKEFLTWVHVHLVATAKEQLQYRRLVAQAD
ncbi:hypothetical protein ACFWWA_36550 [Streptomyces goshikiensis]|uniref:hypothetical protein n=1 Tax=Streptomyces goshikiensis TaxID=1942 RepID=UPI00365C89C8